MPDEPLCAMHDYDGESKVPVYAGRTYAVSIADCCLPHVEFSAVAVEVVEVERPVGDPDRYLVFDNGVRVGLGRYDAGFSIEESNRGVALG